MTGLWHRQERTGFGSDEKIRDRYWIDSTCGDFPVGKQVYEGKTFTFMINEDGQLKDIKPEG